MIRSLRRKFIAISMASMGAVLAIIIVIINVSNYMSMMASVERRMAMAEMIAAEGSSNSVFAPDKFGGTPPELPDKSDISGFGSRDHMQNRIDTESKFDTRFFTVTLNDSLAATDVNVDNIASVDEDGAENIACKIVLKNADTGIYSGFYYKKTVDDSLNHYIICLDISREYSSFLSSLLTTILVSLVGAAAVFVLILFFSKRVMKPVAESYEKQKRFITDASHEIKTPLAIIGANAEVLELESGENQWIDSINHQIKRLTSLTEKLVFLSKMDEEGAGNSLEKTVFDISDAVQETADSFDAVAEARGYTYEKNIEPGLTYYGDAERVRQAASLLIDNAMKYTSEGGTIRVSLTGGKRKCIRLAVPAADADRGPAKGDADAPEKDTENSRTAKKHFRRAKKEYVRVDYTACTLCVYNTADGLTPGSQDMLFERFYRADKSRNSKTGGHGIGLSVVRAIAEAHGGTASAASADGKSIEFKVRLN